MAGNISLTKMLIAALVGTFIVATLGGVYLGFCTLNGCSMEPKYASAFGNISAQYESLSGVASTASDKGLVTNIYNAGASLISGTVNVFVVGLSAIGSLFNMIPIIGNIFSAISTTIPWFSGLIGLLTIIVGLVVAMTYIKSASNKFDLP